MAYTAEISRVQPSCFLFLIDQSGSMDVAIAGDQQVKKSAGVANVINRLLYNLAIKCSKSTGESDEVRNYFDVGVIGYGSTVGSAFAGALAGQGFVTLSQLAENPARVDDRVKKVSDGAGGLVDQRIKFPVWFDPKSEGGTPMCQALEQARQLLDTWIGSHPASYPPVVINITDGEAGDGDPVAAAQALTSLATSDGSVLLFNCHVSDSNAAPIVFPAAEAGLPSDAAKRLFQMSSVLPAKLQEAARTLIPNLDSQARGFAFNAAMVELIQFMEIGTRPSNMEVSIRPSNIR